ncbi:hydroxymethylglutaryl-coenzyme A synthase C terminal-domain-containing protein [Phlyctochytrium arcticum]|nr:hydroxymethylglutaryl-coenzyme A synthase C terminal-domain-containing protein [Phlyctochytrium arcticum]
MLSSNSSSEPRAHPANVGILAVHAYFPKKYVDQTELEAYDGVSAGKYSIGLGQLKMGVCDDREDISSICLTAVKNLLDAYNIDPATVGRLEVGTETIIDKSKSTKSVLMQLFPDNTDMEGVDTTNACYGGTNALFNSLNWIESSAWDGRYAIVVAADIAVYKTGGARPTGGAGAVAMLVGPNAPLVVDPAVRASHMEHVYDFYKPDLHSEYPTVDGPLSNVCYTRALDIVYNRYMTKLANRTGSAATGMHSIDYFCFHCPYSKLVAKSVGRLLYNDLLRHPNLPRFTADEAVAAELTPFAAVSNEASFTDRTLEKAFMTHTKSDLTTKVNPSLMVAKNLGNSYCASLYMGLSSLLSEVAPSDLLNKRVALFSYGSGLAASMFSLTVQGDTSAIHSHLSLTTRLASRTRIAPERYDQIMLLREQTHNCRDYDPVSTPDSDNLFPGTYFLERVDDKFRRTYQRTPSTAEWTRSAAIKTTTAQSTTFSSSPSKKGFASAAVTNGVSTLPNNVTTNFRMTTPTSATMTAAAAAQQ